VRVRDPGSVLRAFTEERRYSHPVDKTTGVRSDHTVILTAINSVKAYPDQLRRVSYLDVKTKKRFKFLTNNFMLPALPSLRYTSHVGKWNCLNQRQTAPYVALCRCALTIVFEGSPYCGHSGRVCHVFWRQCLPWVLVRLGNGETLSVPWNWTNLPQSLSSRECEADGPTGPVPILSPGALRDLIRFLHRRRNRPGREF
jgi:hypothetical protein